MTDEALQREYEQIGLRIRNARVERKMSQAELAAKAKIASSHQLHRTGQNKDAPQHIHPGDRSPAGFC